MISDKQTIFSMHIIIYIYISGNKMSKQDKKLFVKLLALLGTQILVPFAPPTPHYIPSVHLCMCAEGVCVCAQGVQFYVYILSPYCTFLLILSWLAHPCPWDIEMTTNITITIPNLTYFWVLRTCISTLLCWFHPLRIRASITIHASYPPTLHTVSLHTQRQPDFTGQKTNNKKPMKSSKRDDIHQP